jgi:hypothetical protein
VLFNEQKGLPMHVDLIVCPICLRVQRGSEWVEADLVIREIRTYAFATSRRSATFSSRHGRHAAERELACGERSVTRSSSAPGSHSSAVKGPEATRQFS